jgi:kinetochore protein Spc7/SPC105
MLQSCGEMKSYIESGRTEIKSIEAAAIETQPPLFHDYANASFAEKAIMDNQLRDLKTNARLQSKSGWHTWRSQLLNDLKNGLIQTSEELDQDSKMLAPVEKAFSEVVPVLEKQEADLKASLKSLQQRKRDVEDGREADLDEARERLTSTESELQQKKILLERLRSDMADKNSLLEDARDCKAETIGAIKEADRISEECRGWSTKEVLALNDKVKSLESQLGWSLESASGGSVVLKHKELHLTVNPRSWLSKSNSPAANSPNTPISIVYAGPEDSESDTPSATVRRFFLQYIRAQAYALPQFDTRITQLVALVQNGWELACSILAAVQSLEVSGQTDVGILGDEKLGIEAFMFLPMLQTKVRVQFVVYVALSPDDSRVHGSVEVSAQVVYGERYDEPKMASFLQQFLSSGKVGSEDEVRKWANGVDDLKDRLIRTGRKGVRRV